MELQIYYYKNLLSLKIRPFYKNLMLRKFEIILYHHELLYDVCAS